MLASSPLLCSSPPPLRQGYYNEGALHNGAGVPAPCCAITLDGATGNHLDDEWRCHAPVAEPLLSAQWADDGSLAYEAAGAPDVVGHPSAFLPVRPSVGVVPAASLAGALHSFSLTHVESPTNRTLTPHQLLHELGRHGDWQLPGRVDFMVSCEARHAHGGRARHCSADDDTLGAEGEAAVAIGAGRGLWVAVSADGSALLCLHPCLRLTRLSSPSAHSGLAAVAVGNLSLLAVTRDGQLYTAAEAEPTAAADDGDGGGHAHDGGGHGSTGHGRGGGRAVHVPRLGWLTLVRGSLERRRVTVAAASAVAAVALTADGSVHVWGLPAAGAAPAPTASSSDADCAARGDGRCRRVSLSSGTPRIVALDGGSKAAGATHAVSVAVSCTHLLVLSTEGEMFSAALPPREPAAPPEIAALGRPVTPPEPATTPSAASAYELARVTMMQKPGQKPGQKGERLPRIGAVAAGDSFSLALISWGCAAAVETPAALAQPACAVR